MTPTTTYWHPSRSLAVFKLNSDLQGWLLGGWAAQRYWQYSVWELTKFTFRELLNCTQNEIGLILYANSCRNESYCRAVWINLAVRDDTKKKNCNILNSIYISFNLKPCLTVKERCLWCYKCLWGWNGMRTSWNIMIKDSMISKMNVVGLLIGQFCNESCSVSLLLLYKKGWVKLQACILTRQAAHRQWAHGKGTTTTLYYTLPQYNGNLRC